MYILAEINYLIPGAAVSVVIALALLGKIVASRWKTVPPNAIGVFYGRKHTFVGDDGKAVTRGFRTITGGGGLVMPIVERYQEMSIAAFQVDIEEKGVPTAANVPVEINAVATCRISSNVEEQANAVQAFLGKDQREIADTISQILRGHVRSIIATLSVDQILRDRAEFNTKVLTESSEEFRRIGVQIITLVVQDVRDAQGYITALGRSEITAKLRDAAMQTAENEKQTKVAQSNAAREAAEVEAQNAVKIADAQKIRDIQIAEFKTQTETKRAQAEMANAIAKTTQEQELALRTAERDSKTAEAGIAVQQKRGLQREQELTATIIKQAEAESRAAVIKADADQQVAQRQAQRAAIEAEGKKNAAIAEGVGIASKTLAVAESEAKATQIRLTADAEGNRAALMATAAGKQAALLAEAEGTLKLAEALKALDEKGKLLMVLDRIPLLLDKGGDAGAKWLSAVFTPVGNALGAIESVRIVDMGGSDSKGGVAKFAGSIPNMLAEMLAKAEAQGIDLKPLLKLARVDGTRLSELLGFLDAAVPDASVAPATARTPDAPAKK